MKQKIKKGATILSGIALATNAFIACGDDNNNPDKPDPKPYYVWEEADTGLKIEFWQDGDTTKAQMDTLIGALKASYATSFNQEMKKSLSKNLTEIRMKSDGAGISHQGKILTVGNDDAFDDIATYMLNNGIVQMAKFLAPTKGQVVKNTNTKNEVVFKAMQKHGRNIANGVHHRSRVKGA